MNQDDLTPVWKALSDPTRRTILDLLKERPRTTGDLCDSFDVSRYAIMKHLAVLEQAELIVVRRQGRARWNYLNAVPLQAIYERWLRPYEGKWASALLTLKRQIEQPEMETTAMDEKGIVEATLKELQIVQTLSINASREQVFEAITQHTSVWWGAPYQHTPGARRLILESKVGGRLYEDLGNEQGLLMGTVVFIKPPEALRITGPMFMAGPVQGTISFQLESKEAGTQLNFTHRVIGPADEVNEQFRTAYNQGWQDLIGVRLKNYVEQGTRYDLLSDAENKALRDT